MRARICGATNDNAGAEGGGSSRRTIGFIGIGVGAAGVALGGIAGGIAVSKKGDLEGKCGSSLACGSAYAGDVSSYNTARTISSVGFIAGGVLVAAGAVLVFTAPKKAPVAAYVGPASAGIGGEF
jgi:hypothetical protein